MSVRTHLPLNMLLAGAIAAGACSSEPPPAANPGAAGSAPAATASASGGSRRVFFIEPQDGASVKSPVRLRFGVENFEIAAVPAGEVTQARPGMGHHHVGVDTECLPPGSVIPKASPWVHFGDGKNEIEMQLPPGKHTLALEIGDDLHTTLAGLCTTIAVNVME
jgi:Domain of unknown function (DUF4399)/Family of unknown function (DUF6130)